MNAPEPENRNNEISLTTAVRKKWLNFRRKRFWLIVVVLLYTLLGFFLVPVLVENSIIGTARDNLGREASVSEVEFNPYLLSLSIQDFELNDKDQLRLVGFDELFIDFQASSLFRWAWTFKEISLTGFYFLFERFEPEDSRLSRLLADIADDESIETTDSESDGLPRLLIYSVSINEGSGDLVDNVPPAPVKTHLGPISITVKELNTLPDRQGQQSVTIELEQGAILSWRGSLSLAPLVSEGELELKDSRLDRTIAYLKAILPLEAMSATISGRFHYRVYMESAGEPDIEFDDMEFELRGVSLTGLQPSTKFLEVADISLDGGSLRYPEQSLQFASLAIGQPSMLSWLDEHGEFSLSQLSRATGGGTDADGTEAGAAAGWSFGISEMNLAGGTLALADRSIRPEAALELRELEFNLTGLSNQPDARFPFSLSGSLEAGGTFGIEGDIGLLPGISLAGKAHTKGVPLSIGQPYLERQARVSIRQGSVDTEAELSIQAANEVSVSGLLNVHDLEVHDTNENKPLVGWKHMDIDRFELDPLGRNLHLSRLVFNQPYGRLVINEDQTTNIAELLAESESSAPEESDEADSFDVIVGGIAVKDGALDFSDLSLPLPFGTKIAALNGTISTISSTSSESSNIRLEGRVDEFGLARIEGSMNLLDPIAHTDVAVEFRNLLMSDLSPYTIQFAGQEIDEGKLDLDLGYFIDQGQLKGQNAVVLSDLVLGDKVDHPDAASLPLGLAVALLKDSNGVIDIDLPVEGDINDPQFRIGGVVWQAIAGLITKVVAAPFRLLGGLIGIESEDLGQFQFLAGRFDLTPPELEKVNQLQEALQQRPELAVEISGAIDPAIDSPALQYINLRKIVMERLGKEDSLEGGGEDLMVDVEIRQILEALFAERFPETPLESLKAEHTAAPAGDPEAKPVLDDLAYAADLRDRLLASEKISSQDLDMLAAARAEAVRSAFLDSGEFDESRVAVTAATEVESEDGEWVVMELGVAAD